MKQLKTVEITLGHVDMGITITMHVTEEQLRFLRLIEEMFDMKHEKEYQPTFIVVEEAEGK